MESLDRAISRAAQSEWRGYDPYDALLSPAVRVPLIGGNRLFRIALTHEDDPTAARLLQFIR